MGYVPIYITEQPDSGRDMHHRSKEESELLTKTYVGQNEDGTPHFAYVSDGPVLLTGPVFGVFKTADGTEYDVSENVIEVQSEQHAGELAHQIGIHHEQNGHPHHDPSIPFVHTCTPSCGAFARENVTGTPEGQDTNSKTLTVGGDE